ncbi:MAG: GNAT family N-acetyltransferase [Ardenticatenaceae bacterium]
MKLECWQEDNLFDTLSGAWNALHERSHTATVFNSVPYARIWWRHFGVPGTLQVWTVWEDEKLVGVAPLYKTTNEQGTSVLRFVGGVDVSDYLDMVCEPGREDDIVATLLAGWADVPGCCPFDFHAVPHASPSREAFLRLAPAYGFKVTERREEVCPVITLPTTWEGYLAKLAGKQRRELRRKLRKAGQEELVSWYWTPPELIPEEMGNFFRLHMKSGAQKAAFMTEAMQQFFRELAVALTERGWLDLCFLLINGVPAASLLSFHFRNEVQLYNSGLDETLSDALSPGWLLLCYHIEEAIALGRTRYDFLRGNEEYKFRFGGRPEPIYQVQLEKIQ